MYSWLLVKNHPVGVPSSPATWPVTFPIRMIIIRAATHRDGSDNGVLIHKVAVDLSFRGRTSRQPNKTNTGDCTVATALGSQKHDES